MAIHLRRISHVLADHTYWGGPRHRDLMGREYLPAPSAAPSAEHRGHRLLLVALLAVFGLLGPLSRPVGRLP
jgi:hypothetical protein